MKKIYENWHLKIAGLIVLTFFLFRFNQAMTAINIFLGIFMPFIIGGIIALYANVLMKFIEKLFYRLTKTTRYKLVRIVSLLLTIVLLLIVITIIVATIVPSLANTIKVAASNSHKIYVEIREFVSNNIDSHGINLTETLDRGKDKIEAESSKLLPYLQSKSTQVLMGGARRIGGTLSTIFTGFLGTIFAIYVLLDKEKLGYQLERFGFAFFDKEKIIVARHILKKFSDIFYSFMTGSVKEAAAFGVMVFVTMKLFRFPYASTTAIIVATLAFIPYVGAFIAGFIGFLMVATEGLKGGLIFLVVYIVLQQIESNVLYPLIVGDELGLPGMWVLVGVTVGGSILGVFGMVIGVPIAALIYTVVGNIIKYKEVKKKDPDVKLSEFV